VSVVIVAGVEMGYRTTEAILEGGCLVSLIFAYEESMSGASGYVSFDDLAQRYGVAVHKTRDINGPASLAALRAADPEIVLVLGWSRLIAREFLDVPRHGVVGTHPTRLPKHRGRAPIPWTLIHGLAESALSAFYVDPGVDCGDIIAQRSFSVEFEDDAQSLYDKIARLQQETILELLPALLEGRAPRVPQDETQATYWPKRTPADGVMRWRKSAFDQYNWVRGLTRPYPGAFTFCGGRKLTVWAARYLDNEPDPAPPGTVLSVESGEALVACHPGHIALTRVAWETGQDLAPEEAGLAVGQRFEMGEP